MGKVDPVSVALGVDPWMSLPRHPATLAVVGLLDEGYTVQLLCLHGRVAEAARTALPDGSGVQVVGPRGARWVRGMHAARKTPRILASLPVTRSISATRASLSNLTQHELEARSVVRRWFGAEPSVTFLFGANPLTNRLLARQGSGPFVYVETGDFRMRPAGYTRQLVERRAIHVPLDEADAPDGLRRMHPVVFPVEEAFRTRRQRTNDSHTVSVVGFAGRLHEPKGVRHLVEAVRSLRLEGMDVKLELAGEGPQRVILEAMASQLEWFTMHGGIADQASLRRFYDGLDAYVVSSTSEANEGLPVSMLEALLSGVSVVATDVGAIKARVGDLVTMVSPGDPSELAQGIRRALRESPNEEAAAMRVPTPRQYAKALMEGVDDVG